MLQALSYSPSISNSNDDLRGTPTVSLRNIEAEDDSRKKGGKKVKETRKNNVSVRTLGTE
jgi:hypothetical protein